MVELQDSNKKESGNDHHNARSGHHHPHADKVYDHNDPVLAKGMTCDPWAAIWHQWLFTISSDKNPMTKKVENPLKKEYNSYIVLKNGTNGKELRKLKGTSEEDPLSKKVEDLSKNIGFVHRSPNASPNAKGIGDEIKFNGKGDGVLCLAAPFYQSNGTSYSTFESVKPGKWNILFTPVCFYGSEDEYQDLSEKSIFELVKKQLDSVYNLEVTLDGITIEHCRVEISPEDNVMIDVIEKDNILDAMFEGNENRNGGVRKIKLIAAGYFVFLKPLNSGMHLLEFKGYSPGYSLHARFQLDVKGPVVDKRK